MIWRKLAVLFLNTMQSLWVPRSQPRIWRKIPKEFGGVWTPRTLAFWMYAATTQRIVKGKQQVRCDVVWCVITDLYQIRQPIKMHGRGVPKQSRCNQMRGMCIQFSETTEESKVSRGKKTDNKILTFYFSF